MSKDKTFEELAFDTSLRMSEDELKMAIDIQDNELLKQLLGMIGELTKIIRTQGETIKSLSEKVEKLEEKSEYGSKLVTEMLAKIQVLAKIKSQTK